MNIKVEEYKLIIDGEELTFRLDFNALINFNNRYENATEIFNSFLQGKNFYEAVIKILSCCCVEKDLTEEELKSSLSFDFPTMRLIDEVTFRLVQGTLAENNNKTKGTKKEKN